jgi:hypothetical protein
MPITSRDDLIDKITRLGQHYDFSGFKFGPANEAAGVWTSLWYADGMPGAGGNPAVAGTSTSNRGGTVRTNASGSLNFANQSPLTKHLLFLAAIASQDCTLVLYDRLVDVSGIDLTSTGLKNVYSSALPRYTDGNGVEAWLEITTAGTASTPAVRLSDYTDDEGNAGQDAGVSTTLAATPAIRSMYRLTPATGDRGIRSVERVNVITSSTACIANLILLKKIPGAELPLMANQANFLSMVNRLYSLPRIYDGASLSLMLLATGTTAVNILDWQMGVVYG